MNHAAWTPTLAWHAKLFGALLALVTAAYFTYAYVAEKLPEPYQKRPAAARPQAAHANQVNL